MIAKFVEFLVDGVFTLLDTFLGVLAPSSSLDFTSQISSLINNNVTQTVLSWVNYFLPLNTAGVVITAWGGIMLGYLAFKLVMSYGKAAL